ncbi:DUF2510 domain-containing protein [Rhabdothermincola salaria]|uniref:DUF2510 domain-containing protein n=1 Tax=Rhabdothermincola salaria TaxID=2903142 RepID=UPI001E61E4F5|nr:DUF2510 domain-containing protein [Rhabdothermincola salaria]MCD9625314.1 DUF2510 domain-containing protein [Rhabdothermincola salaria]
MTKRGIRRLLVVAAAAMFGSFFVVAVYMAITVDPGWLLGVLLALMLAAPFALGALLIRPEPAADLWAGARYSPDEPIAIDLYLTGATTLTVWPTAQLVVWQGSATLTRTDGTVVFRAPAESVSARKSLRGVLLVHPGGKLTVSPISAAECFLPDAPERRGELVARIDAARRGYVLPVSAQATTVVPTIVGTPAAVGAATGPERTVEPDAVSEGWYPDPSGGGGLRWWNGTGWTDQTA